MKFVLYKMYADPEMSGSTRFVSVREGFENYIYRDSVRYEPDIDRATRFDTRYQATLWQAALDGIGGRIHVVEVTS